MELSEKLIQKVYGIALGAAVTMVTHRVLKAAWKLATGTEPPQPGDPDVPATEAFIWALSSAVGMGAAQLAATRHVARRLSRMGIENDGLPTVIKV
ncbi:DUF4235 domain-containing protein [Tessaracoccus sp. SD287]|uniref:DUF4235 domain-containing protein n=1 Tax=Tessaracoccus sp. SD287 TaxID=2782008 RepID=UPI001A969C5D|nr:DUF4235 domain-containing protein [Tessaracoccus sp. SD287]MBO1029807.1 DUF4235 domain-containing protein [Tessaracoccus sp. SD287]